MSFPSRAQDFRVVVAVRDGEKGGRFLDETPPATGEQPGVYEAAWFWTVEDGHSLSAPGAPSTVVATASAGGSTFGVMRFPAHSAGKLDAASSAAESNAEVGFAEDPGMHATQTVDYELILSGKVDFVLPGGEKRTLVPGDLLVVAGAPHSWQNIYDEDCLYAAVTIGVTPGATS